MKKILVLFFVLISAITFAAPPFYSSHGTIADGSITTAKIADDAVTAAKLDSSGDFVANSITLADKVKAAWAEITGNVYASGTATINGEVYIGGGADAGDYKLQVSGTAKATNFDADGYVYTGKAGTGTGGQIRHRTDSAVSKWICGILGSAGSTDYAVYDLVNAAARLYISGSTGNVLIGTTTDDGSNKLQVNGFSRLGDAATGIKMKVLTGTTGAAEGGNVTVAHGLTGAKIVSFTAKVEAAANQGFPPEYSRAPEYKFSCYHDATNFNVYLAATDSGNILSKPFVIVVWYVE